MDLNGFAWISLLKLQRLKSEGKPPNSREFENLYIFLGFINIVWISKSIKKV